MVGDRCRGKRAVHKLWESVQMRATGEGSSSWETNHLNKCERERSIWWCEFPSHTVKFIYDVQILGIFNRHDTPVPTVFHPCWRSAICVECYVRGDWSDFLQIHCEFESGIIRTSFNYGYSRIYWETRARLLTRGQVLEVKLLAIG